MSRLTLEQTELSLKRWRTKLKRAMTAIETLERKRKRLLKKPLAEIIKPIEITTPNATTVAALKELERGGGEVVSDFDAIPGFLRRDKTPDPGTEAVKAEIEEQKKAKTKARIAKMKAAKSGDLRKMPLSGKAALDAIRNG